jgi:hypothetical protein
LGTFSAINKSDQEGATMTSRNIRVIAWTVWGLGCLTSCSAVDAVDERPQLASSTEMLSPGLSKCELGAITAEGASRGCNLAEAGTERVQGVAAGAAPPLTGGRAYGLALAEVSPGQFVGRFLFRPNVTAEHVVFLGTTTVPVSLRGASGDALRCGRYLSEEVASGLTGKACAELREGIPTTLLSSSESLTLEIGPTSSRWVRFVAIPERVDGQASYVAGDACSRPSPALCEAGHDPEARQRAVARLGEPIAGRRR